MTIEFWSVLCFFMNPMSFLEMNTYLDWGNIEGIMIISPVGFSEIARFLEQTVRFGLLLPTILKVLVKVVL